MESSAHPKFANAAAEVWADSSSVARLTWLPRPRQLTDFQAALNAWLTLVETLRTGKALEDQRTMLPLSPAEQAWMSTNWLPRALSQSCYSHVAILLALDPVARLAATSVRPRGPVPQYQVFEDEVAARGWLRLQTAAKPIGRKG